MLDMKVVTVFGTRPEAIKMFPVVHALREQAGVDARVCVTAQHREILDQVLHIARIVPDIDLDVMQPDQTLDALLARLVTGLGETFDTERPDRVLVHGDTLTTMAATPAAYFRKIRSEEHTSELQSLMRISYAVFCLTKKQQYT